MVLASVIAGVVRFALRRSAMGAGCSRPASARLRVEAQTVQRGRDHGQGTHCAAALRSVVDEHEIQRRRARQAASVNPRQPARSPQSGWRMGSLGANPRRGLLCGRCSPELNRVTSSRRGAVDRAGRALREPQPARSRHDLSSVWASYTSDTRNTAANRNRLATAASGIPDSWEGRIRACRSFRHDMRSRRRLCELSTSPVAGSSATARGAG